jgi:hypothetical protein
MLPNIPTPTTVEVRTVTEQKASAMLLAGFLANSPVTESDDIIQSMCERIKESQKQQRTAIAWSYGGIIKVLDTEDPHKLGTAAISTEIEVKTGEHSRSALEHAGWGVLCPWTETKLGGVWAKVTPPDIENPPHQSKHAASA